MDKEKETREQTIREHIGNRISFLRKLQGLTQKELAEKAGLQRTHISRIESGKYAVTIDTLDTIARVLGCKVDLVI